MKNLLYSILAISICLTLWSCNSDSNAPNEKDVVENNEPIIYDDDLPINTQDKASLVQTTIKSAPPPPPPPRSKTRDSIAQKLTIKSHFLKLGCCEKEKERLANCCCEAVLEEYKKLMESNSQNLANLSTADPILGQCKRKLFEAFDLIDHPPPPKEDVDNYDDLFLN